MSVYVVARDKKDQQKPYEVEACETYDMATKVRDYVKARTDQERWNIDTAYSNTGMPKWDHREMHEAANAPKEGEQQ